MTAGLLARCSFPAAGTAVTCGFSGGADSTALVALAAAAGCVVTAVHVDHHLHPGSTAAARAAAALADRLGVAFRVVDVDVGEGPNLEARARTARLAELGPGALLGHTADDRAETILINLLRGTGPRGLAAMGPSPTRPILDLRRAETAALCTALGLTPVIDPTNRDPRHLRNRVRSELLPLLADLADRDVTPLLTRTGDLVGAEHRALVAATEGFPLDDARVLAALPAALAATAIRVWLDEHGVRADRDGVARVLAVARGAARACELAPGVRIERHRQRLRIVGAVACADVTERGATEVP